MIDKLLNFFYADRCGFAVPEIHAACHLDLFGAHGDEVRSIGGGWHDAGNLCQGSYRTDLAVFALLRLYEQLMQRDLWPELQARVLHEARWGLTWLRLSRFAPGWRITQASFNMYTDGVAGTSDDVIIPATNIPFENILAAMVSAYAARVLLDIDPVLSVQLLTEAREDFVVAREARTEPPTSAAPRTDPNEACWRDELAYAALAAVELYRLTGELPYADAATQLGRAVLDLQEQRFVDGIPITGYFYEDAQRTRIVHEFHTSFEEAAPLALHALCATQQGDSVLLEAHLHGAGAHELELHGFNVTIDPRRHYVDLGSGAAQTLVWTCCVQDQDKPWIVVATVDGNRGASHELLGILHPEPGW